jgi:4'-phosphopantetheinyl transferase
MKPLSQTLLEQAQLAFNDGNIVAWIASPDSVLSVDRRGALETLDIGEQARYAAFRFEADRRAYLAAHALLRAVLADEMGAPPQDISIEEDELGRPMVSHGERTFSASLSRRRGMVGVALSQAGAVGIDVEELSSPNDAAELLKPFLSHDTLTETLARMKTDSTAFSTTWTLIEAFTKACGGGLGATSSDLRFSTIDESRFEIADSHCTAHARLLAVSNNHCAALAWIAGGATK